MPATATKPAVPFADRVTHAYDAATGIVFIGLDGQENGYYADRVEDGVDLTKIVGREVHPVRLVRGGLCCTCRGHLFRNDCRHVRAVARMIHANEI